MLFEESEKMSALNCCVVLYIQGANGSSSEPNTSQILSTDQLQLLISKTNCMLCLFCVNSYFKIAE